MLTRQLKHAAIEQKRVANSFEAIEWLHFRGAGRIFGMSVQRYDETAIAALQPIVNGKRRKRCIVESCSISPLRNISEFI